MKVVRKLFNSDEKVMFNINQATDLFTKFSKSHAVNRLHCDFELLTDSQKLNISKLIR